MYIDYYFPKKKIVDLQSFSFFYKQDIKGQNIKNLIFLVKIVTLNEWSQKYSFLGGNNENFKTNK